MGEIENLPVADRSADVIISNCVINLSPDKPRVFAEAARVLKKGGRLAVYEENTSSDVAALDVYDSFDDLKDACEINGDSRYPENIIAAVASVLDEPYTIELDI